MFSIHVELILILLLTFQNKFTAKNTEYFDSLVLEQIVLKII